MGYKKRLLSVENLMMHFYTSRGILRAVDGISLEIAEKEAVGLVGESGCGKSMTALSIMRLVPTPGKIIGGKILYKGRNLLDLTEKEMRSIRGKEISMVFQDPMTYLNPIMKVGNQITEAISLHQNVDKRETQKRTVEMLERVGMPSPSRVVNYYPHELSGGMRQRVLIAMMLACNSSLLIADEITTALDVTIQAQILDLLNRLKKELDFSLLLITHDLGIVAEVCDRVYIMYAGKIVEYGDVFALYEKPSHPYTKGLMDCVISIDEFKKELVTIEGFVPHLINPPLGCRFHPRCPYAMEVCRKKEPPSIRISPSHVTNCWLYK